ncbi:hypothetical protein BSL78_27872 [Apostichopus japonicus]|uniref:GIY-YIG domain-containing protein n=1 Tax=Stichopus japonicus TaxID=307972 RepID=A0A2G8JHT3_STIJA|nr:hypothetical protein BSL78_27872 [Apostichopus japonicus]
MGTMITPLYLNNFRTSLEEKVLNNCVHLRYIDDKFMVWVYGLLAYDMLVMKPNNFCPFIFTFEKSNSMISFFETFASVDWGRTLTSLYDHHTDNHTYLYCKNHHSHHIKESIVCSRCLRHMIICLFAICFLKQSLTLRVHSLNCGYHPNKFIPCKILANFLKIQRDRNLQYTSKPGSHHIPLALTHIGQMDPSLTSVKEASRLPRLDENVRGVFMHPPVTFRTKPITLRDRLVKRRLSSHVTTSGNIKCGKTRCKTCKHMVTDQTITLSPSGHCLRPGPYNCDSSHVVYVLMCSLCPNIQYVGQTSKPFRERFNKHKSHIRLNKTGIPVVEHFNLSNHNLDCLRFVIIKGNLHDHYRRVLLETELIVRIRSHVYGLNA